MRKNKAYLKTPFVKPVSVIAVLSLQDLRVFTVRDTQR